MSCSESVLGFGVRIKFFRIYVRHKQSMHKILLEAFIHEKGILIKTILPLMMLAYVLHGHQMQCKLDQVEPSVHTTSLSVE